MNENHVAVGGDFNKIFDHKDFLSMINIPDEATCVLRGHLILEEILNLYSSKLTNTEDLFEGPFISFKNKLHICKNLGLHEEVFETFDKINNIRNRFSHRKGYALQNSETNALKDRINKIIESAKVQNCEDFHVFTSGKDQNGNTKEIRYTWENSDNRIKFVLLFVILLLKVTYWIQEEFNNRGIKYKIIETI